MTIGTITLAGLTGGLILVKLALMAFALFLMAKALFQARPAPMLSRATARLPRLNKPRY